MIGPVLIAEHDLGHIAERRRRMDHVCAIKTVPEAELDVDDRGPIGHYRNDPGRRIVLAQMPVLVVYVHFDVEWILDLAILALAARVEDDLGIHIPRDGGSPDLGW